MKIVEVRSRENCASTSGAQLGNVGLIMPEICIHAGLMQVSGEMVTTRSVKVKRKGELVKSSCYANL